MGLHRSYIIQIPNLFKTLSRLGSSEVQCGAKEGRKKLVLFSNPQCLRRINQVLQKTVLCQNMNYYSISERRR